MNSYVRNQADKPEIGLSGALALSALVTTLGVAACGGAKQQVVVDPLPAAPKVKTAAEYGTEAEASLKSGDYAAAVKSYDIVLTKDPENVGVVYNRAFALHRIGDLDAAQTGYEQALKMDPGSTDAAVNLGALLKDKGELDQAIAVTKKALEADEFNGRLLNNLSVLQLKKGNHDGAVAAVRKLLMRDKKNVDAYKNLSLVYFDQKKYKLSQTILENALKMAKEQKKEDPDLYVNMGMIYLARTENGKAMAAFKKAKELKADHPVANYNIGALALGHRDYNLAADSYATVSQSWKDNYEVVVGHGYALQGQGKLEEASTELQRARTLLVKLPTSPKGEEENILQQLMVIYQGRELPQESLKYAEEYMKIKGLTCGEEDFDGFCGRYNGIKLMIEMAAEEAAPPPEEEEKEAIDASEATIFTEGDDPAPGEDGGEEAEGEVAPEAEAVEGDAPAPADAEAPPAAEEAPPPSS